MLRGFLRVYVCLYVRVTSAREDTYTRAVSPSPPLPLCVCLSLPLS